MDDKCTGRRSVRRMFLSKTATKHTDWFIGTWRRFCQREMEAARLIQEALAWHHRMLKARLQSAEVEPRPIQGPLDVVLGYRGTQDRILYCQLAAGSGEISGDGDGCVHVVTGVGVEAGGGVTSAPD